MHYKYVRDSIKSGDVLAWSHRSGWFKSWYDFKINLVRLFTRSEYSHVGVAWVFGGRVFVLESVTPLVRVVPLSNLLPAYHLAMPTEMTDQQLERGLSLVGKGRYSEGEAALAALDKNNLTNDRWQCAEYTKFVLDLDCQATPSALVEHCLKQGAKLQGVY